MISTDNTHVKCAITPSDSDALTFSTTYVYDVEVRDSAASLYPLVYTLLSGTITVTEDVGDAA